jgi:hypothetical protein
VKPFLLWKSNKGYILVCVGVRPWVHARARVALFIQHEQRMRRVVICGFANPSRNAYAPYYYVICGPLWLHQIFRHYFIKGAIFGKKVSEHKMCVLILSTTCV